MAITTKQIIDSLLKLADDLCSYLKVHDAETAIDCEEQLKEIEQTVIEIEGPYN